MYGSGVLWLLSFSILVISMHAFDESIMSGNFSQINLANLELECLKNIIRETFRNIETTITIPITRLSSRANDVQNDILHYLNYNEKWTLKILAEPPHLEFKSSEICYLEEHEDSPSIQICRRKFVVKETSEYHLLIVDSIQSLKDKLYSVYNTSSFNPTGKFLIYYQHSNNVSVSEMLPIFQKYFIFKIVFVDHENKTDSMRIFINRVRTQSPGFCLQANKLIHVGLCQKNETFTTLRALILSKFPNRFKNCTVQGIAMKYEPFVINKTHGFEIEILKNVAQHLNITYDMEISMQSKDWGDKVNGTWQDNFGKIFNSFKFGIGNVAIEADRIQDFEFTYSHYSTTLIWVVPIANYVEKWRVLTIIFTLDIWAISSAVLFTVAILFTVAARISGDITYFKSLSGAFLSSFQIILNNSVYKTPRTNSVKFIFVIGLIFALLITCVYNSGLMHVLTNAIREHQIDNVEEILKSGLEIGGLMEYKERFANPEKDECENEIFRRYKHFSGENDSAQIWLNLVEKRKACTPLPRPFVQYYMIKTYEKEENNPTGETKKIKLFIVNNPINFYPLAMVMRRGNPLRKTFDEFLKRFIESGLLLTILHKENKRKFLKLTYLAELPDNGPEQLNVYHLQGLFAILGMGYLIAILAFVIEITFCKLNKRYAKKGKGSDKYRKNDQSNKKFYYDERYGDMYGKTFPKDPHKIFPL